MGLDMFLYARRNDVDNTSDHDDKKCWNCGASSKPDPAEDLGYWRKHPNLHGYIVNTFADGLDECQEIPLSKENLENIIQAVKDNNLPYTQGFFFGESYGDEAPQDIRIFTETLNWLKENPQGSIYYRASW